MTRYVLRIKNNAFEKRCSDCKKWKQLTKFNRNRVRRDGFAVQCRDCAHYRNQIRTQLYRERNDRRVAAVQDMLMPKAVHRQSVGSKTRRK